MVNIASKVNAGGCVEQLITHGHSFTHDQELASGGTAVSCCRVNYVTWVLQSSEDTCAIMKGNKAVLLLRETV